MECEKDDFVDTKPGRTGSLECFGRAQPVPFAARWLTLAFIFGLARAVGGYSVLTHEEIVDMLWNDEIQHPVAASRGLTRNETKRQRKLWLRTLGELERLKAMGSAQQLSRRPAVTNASR